MSWRRNDPNPLKDMRQKLAEQERLLAEQMARLNDQLDPSGKRLSSKPAEPPVWRLEEDVSPQRVTGSTPVTKRHLARQTQRDMWLFFIAVGILLAVMIVFVWVAYVRNTAPNIGP
jgi:hypothetical protein